MQFANLVLKKPPLGKNKVLGALPVLCNKGLDRAREWQIQFLVFQLVKSKIGKHYYYLDLCKSAQIVSG
jgi:hypothetical protein